MNAAKQIENTQAAQQTHPAMGTIMSHKAFGAHAAECLSQVYVEINRLESELSRFLPGSDISRINDSVGMEPEKISADTFTVLSKAIEYSRAFPGCFNVTIEPLVSLWQAARASATQPDVNEIQQALPLVNDQDLILDGWEMTAALKYMGQSIDLGGIGKGFTGDKIRAIFKDYGITSAYSNLGGNVVTVGSKPDGTPWSIGINHPRLTDCLIGCVAVEDQAVVTSGDYQRYFTDSSGKRRHHILKPTSGYPAESGLISVSIVTNKAIAADALSTIIFVAGLEKGLEYLERFPHTGAILVDDDLEVYITQSLKDRFQAEQNIKMTILN